MNWNSGIRQFHRWTSIVFTVAVIFNTIMLVLNRQATWVGLTALFPLILLMITGLYMFALPYLTKSRKTSPAREAA
jgi:ATP/ADP translocase